MWNRSYRWQQQARLAAGVVAILAIVVGILAVCATESAKRVAAGAQDLLSEVRSPAEQTIEVRVPTTLSALTGTLVYLERQDGAAQVIGRVVAVEAVDRDEALLTIRFTTSLAGGPGLGGVLRGVPASLDLRAALRLLVSPDTLDKEFSLARETIWPSIQANVLPDMIAGLIRETTNELVAPDREDADLFAKSLESLRATLEPLEEELLDRLTKRAWEVVGIPGLAAGIWRTTTDGVQNRGVVVADWWWKLFGSRTKPDVSERPFLSDEKSELLQTALEQEALTFWNEHRSEIVEALMKVASEQRPGFEAAFRDRWGTMLYERAILPAWQAGQEEVLETVQVYASDFVTRRLLTRNGGPRLLLAYALRSSLQISEAPLLVFTPAAGEAPDGIVYEPLLR